MRINEGKMLAWELFYIHNSGTESPYNYATVDVFENLQAALKGITIEEAKKVWGEKYNDVFKKTTSLRNLVYSETLANEMGIQPKEPEKYLLISFMKTNDLGKYLEMEKKAYMPMHQAAVEEGKMVAWSVWSRWFPGDTSFDAVTVNAFASAEQLNGMNYESLFEKAKSGKNTNDLFEMVNLMDETSSIRTIVKSQLWELLDITQPKK